MTEADAKEALNDKKNDKNSGVSDEGTSEQKDIETDNTIEDSAASTAESESAETGASGVSNDSLHYDPKDSISWPINGNVIIPYSMDTTVYFETLKEYKCSPAMVIEAQTGDEVKAVYESKVAEVSSNPELGNYVKLELGDGYTVTLGQLQDVKVALGEHLDAGQVVGTIGEPSRFYSEEGSNLYFAVEKDGFATIPWRDKEDRPYKQKSPTISKIDIVGLLHYILTYIFLNVLYNPRSILAHYNLY